MPARLPLLRKTPFQLDPRPLAECSSAQAGLLSASRALRSLQLPGAVEANVSVKQRARGLSEAQDVESAVLLHIAGGEGYDDAAVLADDRCLERGLGYTPTRPDALRKFLEAFHDPEWEKDRPAAEVQKTFLPEPTPALEGLGQAATALVHQIGHRYTAQGQPQRIATLDADATIIESQKRAAKWTDEGTRGYQPLVVVWAELDVVVADEFREGNVPARQAPLPCVRAAFAALPGNITERYFRGDSACHENALIGWLDHPDRAAEPGGPIGFGISAVQTEPLAAALRAVPERQWQTFGQEADGTRRQWAELDYVPGAAYEPKQARPLRYVGLRLAKPQGELFADGTQHHYHAVISNRRERGDRLLVWHRQKAGTVEHTHEEVKNGLGGGRLPSGKFGANAAWFRLSLMAYNVVSAMRGLALEESLRTAKLKRLRLWVFALCGRMSCTGGTLRLRLSTDAEGLRRLQKIWEVFWLPTQATFSG